jgi:hypothetical protein
MGGVCRRGAKMEVEGAEVARRMRSTAAMGEVADLERARKGWVVLVGGALRGRGGELGGGTSRALRAFVCSIVGGGRSSGDVKSWAQ